MDIVALGACKILFSICKFLVTLFLYSLKILIWILNKLRMTVVAAWVVGFVAMYEIKKDWFETEWILITYLVLGGIILIISVFCLLGDIIRLVFPQFSFLDIPDYFSPEKGKIVLLTNETEWFNGLNSKKKINRRYKALKECFIYSSDISEQEKLLQIEKEYKSIMNNIG